MLLILKTRASLRKYLDTKKQKGKQIGFVPTMGALHAGHLRLVSTSHQAGLFTVCSIFVNPTQFNDKKDFEKYPNTIEHDIRLLEEAGCDLLFLPGVEELYPDGLQQLETYPLGRLEEVYEGKYRPGHFQGVSQVMRRLLESVQPDELFMGQKDYQQCMVVKKLIELLGMSIRFTAIPTVREDSGLAMSSRNLRLTEDNRSKASLVHATIEKLCSGLQEGELSDRLKSARQELSNEGFLIDYIDLADAANLEPVSVWNGKTPLVALAAVYLQEVRLIDNILACSPQGRQND